MESDAEGGFVGSCNGMRVLMSFGAACSIGYQGLRVPGNTCECGLIATT